MAVTDPAGRTVTYTRAKSSLTSQLTSAVTTDAAGHTIETWSYHYYNTGDSACPANGYTGPATVLCTAVYTENGTPTGSHADPPTTFTYTASASGAPMVATVTERDTIGVTTFTYQTANNQLDTDVQRGQFLNPTTGASSLDTIRYNGIDASGRADQILDGTEPSVGGTVTAYGETDQVWDSTGCQPRYPGAVVVDNDLCQVTRQAGAPPAGATPPAGWAMTPNSVETFEYTPLGQVLFDRTQPGGTTAPVTTTYGYVTEYFFASVKPTTLTDTPAGSGQLKLTGTDANGNPVSTPPAGQLYAVSDRTALLSPRGNDTANQGSYTAYLTSYTVDDNPGVAPGTFLAGSCGKQSVDGNTGLLCSQSVPDASSPGGAQVTSYTYGLHGEKASMTDPAANAVLALDPKASLGLAKADKCAVNTGTPTDCATLYGYFPAGALALTDGTAGAVAVSAADWLQSVTDPYGNFVAYGYDAAGQVVRTWDRDATAANGAQSTSYPLGNGTDSQSLYADPANADPVDDPWRYLTQSKDALGNQTVYSVDGDGNRLGITTPDGNTTTQVFDGDDQLVSTLAPGNTAPTLTSYDANGNPILVEDATGHYTATVYDPLGRPVANFFTRGAPDANTPATCVTSNGANPALPAGTTVFPANATYNHTTGVTTIPAGLALCDTTTTYDGQGDTILAFDANGVPTWTAFDGTGRQTAQFSERAASPATWEETQKVYDSDGNVTVDCPATQAANEPGVACAAGDHYSTATAYDPLDRPTAVTTYRQATNPATGAITSGWQTLTVTTTYQQAAPVAFSSFTLPAVSVLDADGNAGPAAQDPAHTTITVSDLNGRKLQQLVPRDTTGDSTITIWGYDPSGDQTSTAVYPAMTTGTTTTLAAATDITDTSYDADHRPVDVVDAATDLNAASPANPNNYLAVGGSAPANVRTRNVYDADGNRVGIYQPNAFTASVTTPNPEYLTWVDYDAQDRPVTKWTPVYDNGAAQPIGNADTAACPTQSTQTPTWGPVGRQGVTIPTYPAGVGLCRTHVAHDPVGNIFEIDNPAGNDPAVGPAAKTVYQYTNDNLVSTVTTANPATSGPASVTARSYAYDADGRGIQEIDTTGPGANTTMWTTATAWSPDGHATQIKSTGNNPACPANQTQNPSETQVQTETFDPDGNPATVSTYTAAGPPSGPADSTTTSYFSDGTTYQSVQNQVTTYTPTGAANQPADQTTRYNYLRYEGAHV